MIYYSISKKDILVEHECTPGMSRKNSMFRSEVLSSLNEYFIKNHTHNPRKLGNFELAVSLIESNEMTEMLKGTNFIFEGFHYNKNKINEDILKFSFKE